MNSTFLPSEMMSIASMSIALTAVAALSWIVWLLSTFLRQKAQPSGATAVLTANRQLQPSASAADAVSPLARANVTDDDEDGILSLIRRMTSQAPHASSPTVTTDEAILPFRVTKAALYESEASRVTLRESNKRDRARVLAKLFSSTRQVFGPSNGTTSSHSTFPFQPPGPRGANVIIAVPEEHIHCRKLARILYLLATYYNVFLLIDLTQQDGDDYRKHSTNMQTRIGILRGRVNIDSSIPQEDMDHTGFLPEEVLPSHRILGIRTVAGKIAFVRNFPRKPDFILDYDTSVKDTLVRFGFTVFMYHMNDELDMKQSLIPEPVWSPGKSTACVSSLGRDLL